MKVSYGVTSRIPAGCTDHCRWVTDGVRCNKLMILCFSSPLPDLLMYFEEMTTWSSGFYFYVCIHPQWQWGAQASLLLCNFEVFTVNGEKVNLLLLTFSFLKALMYLCCNKTVIQLPEQAPWFSVFMCIVYILSGLVWAMLLNVLLWKSLSLWKQVWLWECWSSTCSSREQSKILQMTEFGPTLMCKGSGGRRTLIP